MLERLRVAALSNEFMKILNNIIKSSDFKYLGMIFFQTFYHFHGVT